MFSLRWIVLRSGNEPTLLAQPEDSPATIAKAYCANFLETKFVPQGLGARLDLRPSLVFAVLAHNECFRVEFFSLPIVGQCFHGNYISTKAF